MANKRGRMNRADRAKQFIPFDALKGFREALSEQERLVVPRKELSGERKEELNRRLCQLCRNDYVMVEYFQKGEYVRVTGRVAGIDAIDRVLQLEHTGIRIEDISDLARLED